MSLPPELGWLCSQLAAVSPEDLPRHVPELLRLILRCKVALSSPTASKSAPSEFTVPVHKLKTQLSSLLNSKNPEGRFAAVVLVKGAVEVGGWEVLQTSEPWVRGLISILVVSLSFLHLVFFFLFFFFLFLCGNHLRGQQCKS